jgi:16S rRNA (cytidine1402-2'-O)-methyltransferase
MASLSVKKPHGTLYVVATPLGNLDDLTIRAAKCLKEVDLVVCEDTRRTGTLLRHLDVRKPVLSLFEHNERDRVPEVLERIERGENVALVSDAGTPTISDPGFQLVRAARQRKLAVSPIPGPSAVVTALSVSGLPTDAFFFGGFLPRGVNARRARLDEMKLFRATLVFYEAPHRALDALSDLIDILGDREAFLCREVTKLHEELRLDTLSGLRAELATRDEIRGEIVLVVAGAPEVVLSGSIDEALGIFEREIEGGATPRVAAKQASLATGLPAREVYARAVRRP